MVTDRNQNLKPATQPRRTIYTLQDGMPIDFGMLSNDIFENELLEIDDQEAGRDKLGLALAGVGYRSVAFNLGVLANLAEKNLLEKVELLVTESGGSLCVGLVYALSGYRWPSSEEFLQDILPKVRRTLTSTDLRVGWWGRLLDWLFTLLGFRREHALAKLLREQWGIASSLTQLPSVPRWMILSTCHEVADLWLFGRELIGNDKVGYTVNTRIHLYTALAASATLSRRLELSTQGRAWFRFVAEDTQGQARDAQGRKTLLMEPEFSQVQLYDRAGLDVLKVLLNWPDLDFIIASDASANWLLEDRPGRISSQGRISNMARETKRLAFIQQLEEGTRDGVFLNLGDTCRRVYENAGVKDGVGEICARYLSTDEVRLAAALSADLQRLAEDDYERLFKHGKEVADYSLNAYYPGKFVPEAVPEAEDSQLRPRPPEEPPEGLVDALVSGQCVLFAGGGLAAQAGLPTWQDFLQGLIDYAHTHGELGDGLAKELLTSLLRGRVEAVASELVYTLKPEIVQEYVKETYQDAVPSQAHELLGKLPFVGAISTSYDTLLLDVFADRSPVLLFPKDAADLIDALRENRFFVNNLYGAVGNPDVKPFTQHQFTDNRIQSAQYRDFIATLYQRYSLFFVGASINHIRDFLDTMGLAGKQKPEQRHYALVGEPGELDATEINYLDRIYNLQVLGFRPQDVYSEVAGFLEKLEKQVYAHSTSEGEGDARQIINKVVLQNIGPFQRLEIDLAPNWNILLGDNGMGKSIILRAIAAALLGDAMDVSSVERLLNTDSDEGMIEVVVGKRSYRVTLERDPDGRPVVTSRSLSPLRLDKWLVLGFPALRSMSWERPKGPGEEDPIRKRPSPDDLRPILTGEPDNRLNDLKQWIINLDYQAVEDTPEAEIARALKKRFFDVLDRITPEVKLKLSAIDRQRMTINLETDGGIVPLEAVSQGTASIICWVGTLLQRLYEVHSTLENPIHGPALVMVDEIDAHMHPGWQRLLPEKIRELFPNVQVIANTHSPLIVGSLAPEEILVVHRAPLIAEFDAVLRIEERPGREDVGDSHAGKKTVLLEVEDGVIYRYQIPENAALIYEDGEGVEAGDQLTEDEVIIKAEKLGFDVRGWRADQILTAPLFDLDSARSPETARLIDKYTRLAAEDERSPEQEQILQDYAQKLNIRMPNLLEREEARQAYDLIRLAVAEQTRQLSPQERDKIIAELKVQIQESITGSRRPQ